MIDRKSLAITIPINTSKGLYTIYIPDLPKERVAIALPILGHLYSEQKRLGYDSSVLVQDIEYYARQACKVHSIRWARDAKEAEAIEEKLFTDFTNFITAAFTAATVVKPDFTTAPYPSIMAEFSDDDRTRAEGYFSFFYAVLRYAYQTFDPIDMAGWTSSLPVSEFAKRSMTLSSSAATSSATHTG